MTSPSKRRDMDVMKLMMNDYTVETIDDGINVFNVEFHGPKESPYEGGVWKVHIELPDVYPFKSPSIGFLNKIHHPNIDEMSGSVCLDVINQTWSPMFEFCELYAKKEDITETISEETDDDFSEEQSTSSDDDDNVVGDADP